jgi:hypothetical protein
MIFIYKQIMLRISATVLAVLFFVTAMIAPERAHNALKKMLLRNGNGKVLRYV